MLNYKVKLHGRCPFNRDWDYYDLTVTSEVFVKCEDIQAVCDIVRGAIMTQENMAKQLRELLPAHTSITLVGWHANTETVVELPSIEATAK